MCAISEHRNWLIVCWAPKLPAAVLTAAPPTFPWPTPHLSAQGQRCKHRREKKRPGSCEKQPLSSSHPERQRTDCIRLAQLCK